MTPVESIPTGNSTGTHLKMMTLPCQTSPEMAFILICRENKKISKISMVQVHIDQIFQ